MDFLTLANARYSCRKISSKPVESEKLNMIKQAATAAPSAHNNQPCKVWLLRSEQSLTKLKTVVQQPFVQSAPACFVIGSDISQGWIREEDSMNFADIDAAIVATHIMLAIHDLDLVSTWVGHFPTEDMKKAFPMMQPYHLIAIFPVGYPDENAKPSHLHRTRKAEKDFIEVL